MPDITDKEVIKTMRLLLAACVSEYGVLNRLVLTRRQLESVEQGELKVADRPDGTIVLTIKSVKKLIV